MGCEYPILFLAVVIGSVDGELGKVVECRIGQRWHSLMRVVGVGWLMRDADLVCDTCDCVCKESAQLRISQDQDATKKRDMQQKYLSLLILNQSS